MPTAEKELVELQGRRYELHPHGWGGYRVYHRIERARGRHTLVRVRHPGLQKAVLQELQKERERKRRKAAAVRRKAAEAALGSENGDAPLQKTEPSRKKGRIRRAFGYPIRWWKAFWRARTIESDAGPWTWARKATLWALTDK